MNLQFIALSAIANRAFTHERDFMCRFASVGDGCWVVSIAGRQPGKETVLFLLGIIPN